MLVPVRLYILPKLFGAANVDAMDDEAMAFNEPHFEQLIGMTFDQWKTRKAILDHIATIAPTSLYYSSTLPNHIASTCPVWQFALWGVARCNKTASRPKRY